MTILQVCAYAAPYEGNFIRSLKALSQELGKKNIRTIFAFPENAESIKWVKDLAITYEVFFLPLSKARIRIETYDRLRKIYLKYPDLSVIHSHFELYDMPVSLTAPDGVKVFWHLHDALEMYSSFKHRIVHKVQYGLCHRKARLLSVSEKHMRYVLSCGFPSTQAQFIPNGIDTDRIRLVDTDYSKRKYDFVLFGWEFERKGVDLCIEAVKRAKMECKIAIVGTEDTQKMIADRFGDVPQVEVIKPVTDINSLYAETRCFLHISRAEGLSYALLEAIYAGVPVICSDISENQFAEVFPTVTMVKNSDINSIADAMVSQLHSGCVSNISVSTSRKIIEDDYSVVCWVQNIMKQYGLTDE